MAQATLVYDPKPVPPSAVRLTLTPEEAQDLINVLSSEPTYYVGNLRSDNKRVYAIGEALQEVGFHSETGGS